MNPAMLAIFVLNAAVALFVLLSILRVAVGQARFSDGPSAIFNFVLLAACAGLAAWSYPQAFPA
jgi:hypothetical protein